MKVSLLLQAEVSFGGPDRCEQAKGVEFVLGSEDSQPVPCFRGRGEQSGGKVRRLRHGRAVQWVGVSQLANDQDAHSEFTAFVPIEQAEHGLFFERGEPGADFHGAMLSGEEMNLIRGPRL